MNIPEGTFVTIEPTGELRESGERTIVRDALPPGAYVVVEDLGRKITLQLRRGGPLITTYKI